MSSQRRRRAAQTYARRGPQREPYATILIVCEGRKSEPRYFGRLCSIYRLSNANIRVTPADGTDPISIVSYAQAEMDGFDRAYCVFDRNGHDNYDAALEKIANSPEAKTGRLFGITSWPCFEFWILLHFGYSSAPFQKTGNESACDKAVRKLRVHLPGYVKGHKNIFDEIEDKLDAAIRNAMRLAGENRRTGLTCPRDFGPSIT